MRDWAVVEITSGRVKSFQASCNAKTPRVTADGFANDGVIVKNIANSLAPSIREVSARVIVRLLFLDGSSALVSS